MGDSNEREFYISNGRAYRFEGEGEWTVTPDQNGGFSITHNIRGQVTDYGTPVLSVEKNATLWSLVDMADLNKMKLLEHFGILDEIL